MPSPNEWTEELKIQVTKLICLDSFGHYRFFHPNFEVGYHNKRIRPNINNIFALNCESHRYPEIRLRSEKELCWFIYQRWGAGIYLVWYWRRGLKGRYVMWRGEIADDGFCFEKYYRPQARALKKLKRELKDPYLTSKERESLINDIRSIQEDPSSHIPKRKPSYIPYLFPSSRRGEFMPWDLDVVIVYGDEENIQEELTFDEMDRIDEEESEKYFKEIENNLKESNPELFKY